MGEIGDEFFEPAALDIVFLVVSLVAELLGFGRVAGTAMEGTKILFWVAIARTIVALVVSLGQKPQGMGSG